MYVRVESRRPCRPTGRAAAYSRGARMLLVPGILTAGLGAAQAVTPAQLSVADLIVAAANQYGIDPRLPLGIAAHESGFNPLAVNPNGGAAGVMQLMPSTAATLGVTNPLDAQQNIDGGVRLLSQLLAKYNGDTTLALWAYSNGSGNVLAGGMNPANMPAQAAGLVSYVDAYQPPASLDLYSTPDLTGDGSGDTTGETVDGSPFDLFSDMDPSTLAIGGALLGLVLVSMIE
jgi:soluble lytic murein transglycosylase-like protein